ncbi:dephospho-CoA kinase [Paenibacillus sambharensis]|uniref:Dephospho-CoA kinase n=1 Tax=Paenibacillus sambharensis TaxID=1803190 RepID=A0A2W1LLK7_9BACL|nr:dephospho-CoA kinase [Paenibacillus sambharensis]PZD95842.1 dephospho-CoA kinase [Paenibacillus sambharensis]
MKIGLTGGIACGKSTVAAMLRQRGAMLVDADQVAREIVLPGEPALSRVTAVFGQAVINPDGTLNRAKLGGIVFADKDKLRQLEGILHPAIRERMWAVINAAEQEDPGRLIAADIPLLYETGQQDLYDGILVVYIPRELQLKRLQDRNPDLSEEQAKQRIDSQMDIDRKRELADWVIDNSGTLDQTEQQVDALWTKWGLR